MTQTERQIERLFSLGVVLKKKFGQKSELSYSAETPPPSKVRHTFKKYFYCIFELYSLCLLFGE